MTHVKILRVASNGGGVETVASLPGDEIGSVTMTPDSQRVIYPVFSSRSDVWIVDDFDCPSPRADRRSLRDWIVDSGRTAVATCGR
jgi:hypothetical protein